MREVEYDRLTGIKTTIDYQDDGKVEVIWEQDVEPIKHLANELRKKNEPTNKETWNHYAFVPVIHQLEMLNQGIDMYRDPKAAVQWINKHHPELRVTDKWHDDKRAGRRDARIIVK